MPRMPQKPSWIWDLRAERELSETLATLGPWRSNVGGELLSALDHVRDHGSHVSELQRGRVRAVRGSSPDAALNCFFGLAKADTLVIVHLTVTECRDGRCPEPPEADWNEAQDRLDGWAVSRHPPRS